MCHPWKGLVPLYVCSGGRAACGFALSIWQIAHLLTTSTMVAAIPGHQYHSRKVPPSFTKPMWQCDSWKSRTIYRRDGTGGTFTHTSSRVGVDAHACTSFPLQRYSFAVTSTRIFSSTSPGVTPANK